MFAVKLDTRLGVQIVESKPGQGFLDFCYEQIGCNYIEKVNAQGLKAPFVLVIDEEGRLKEKPEINYIASYLYGTSKHLQPIVGNALVMALTYEDIIGLTEEQARAVEESMDKIKFMAYAIVRAAYDRVATGKEEV